MDEEEYHQCHFCSEYVKNGLESNGKRHYLSDCRPDLVEHEIGDTCTWAYTRTMEEKYQREEKYTCYAYQETDAVGQKDWTDEHVHFYKDGPM